MVNRKDYEHILITPPNFSEQNVKVFLGQSSAIFGSKEPLDNFLFDAQGTRKISLIGLVLIYKFFEYTVRKHVFRKPTCSFSSQIEAEMLKNKFYDLVFSFINREPQRYDKLKFDQSGNMFIAPITLDRLDIDTANTLFADKICQYYSYDNVISSVVLQVLAESASNFMAHATDDTKSVLVARGDKEKFQLCCADTGIGIVSSLKPIFQSLRPRLTNFQILLKSIEKGVTSDINSSLGHMGSGLWIINNYVTASGGSLYIYSEDAYLINKGGRLKYGASPYWKGTIISIQLPLKDSRLFQHAMDNMGKNFTLL